MSPSPRLRLPVTAAQLTAGMAAIRAELGLPSQFPAEVLAEASATSRRMPSDGYADARDVPFVTIDPAGSRDLDQALHLAREGDGYRLSYAIADPGLFVDPGSELDAETRRRGHTIYSPQNRVPLYPTTLSEGSASLLPDVDRPSVLWQIDLDAVAEPVRVDVRRAVIRSRSMLTYAGVQVSLDVGNASESLVLVREVGRLRQERERERGGVSLLTPIQEVVRFGASYRLGYTATLPVEDWNAQLSLLTGMCAARIMLDAGVGLLRTLPRPGENAVAPLRSSAELLDVPWPDGVSYAEFIRGLDPREPTHAALLALAPSLLRGAGYTPFDGAPPANPEHGAIAAPYAHVTAPLRRLGDRFATEIVLAAVDGRDPPAWAREALPDLPDAMARSTRVQRELDRRVLDYVEAAVLSSRVGDVFDAVVVDVGPGSALVMLADPAVVARATGEFTLGARTKVRLEHADPARRCVDLVAASPM